MHTWPNGTGKLSSQHGIVADTDGRQGDWDSAGAAAERAEPAGSVRISRRVLRTVVEQAALRVTGVARMAVPAGWQQWGRGRPQHGVSLAVHGESVAIDLYLIVEPEASMVKVGTDVQEAVGAAVEHILGMSVSEINVYIQDVA